LDSKLRLILQPQKTTAQKYNSYQNRNEAFVEIYVIASLHCEQLGLLQCWQSLEAGYSKKGNLGIRIKSNKDALRALFFIKIIHLYIERWKLDKATYSEDRGTPYSIAYWQSAINLQSLRNYVMRKHNKLIGPKVLHSESFLVYG